MNESKTLIESLINHLGASQSTIDMVQDGTTITISITSPDDHILIGRENERFEAVSHLIKRMLAKTHGEDTRIIVDINGLLAKRDDQIRKKASMMAERARAFKIDVELDPMSSYERMIIHSHLENEPSVRTEPVGEGRNRRLVIRYSEEPKTI